MNLRECLVCGGSLEAGFVLDNTYGGRLQQEWAKGPPERSFWTGIKQPKRSLKIVSHRCTKCGFVMEFAAESDA